MYRRLDRNRPTWVTTTRESEGSRCIEQERGEGETLVPQCWTRMHEGFAAMIMDGGERMATRQLRWELVKESDLWSMPTVHVLVPSVISIVESVHVMSESADGTHEETVSYSLWYERRTCNSSRTLPVLLISLISDPLRTTPCPPHLHSVHLTRC